jgi:hypothetical protein
MSEVPHQEEKIENEVVRVVGTDQPHRALMLQIWREAGILGRHERASPAQRRRRNTTGTDGL